MRDPNWQHLDPNKYHGTIKDVTITWEEKVKKRIVGNPDYAEVWLETIKALTENFLYRCAVRLERTHVKIMYVTYEIHLLLAKLFFQIKAYTNFSGGPHRSTKDAETGKVTPDDNHVTGLLKKGENEGEGKVNVSGQQR
jgi:hypothetical protein